jgi:hypothetical protein
MLIDQRIYNNMEMQIKKHKEKWEKVLNYINN